MLRPSLASIVFALLHYNQLYVRISQCFLLFAFVQGSTIYPILISIYLFIYIYLMKYNYTKSIPNMKRLFIFLFSTFIKWAGLSKLAGRFSGPRAVCLTPLP